MQTIADPDGLRHSEMTRTFAVVAILLLVAAIMVFMLGAFRRIAQAEEDETYKSHLDIKAEWESDPFDMHLQATGIVGGSEAKPMIDEFYGTATYALTKFPPRL